MIDMKIQPPKFSNVRLFPTMNTGTDIKMICQARQKKGGKPLTPTTNV